MSPELLNFVQQFFVLEERKMEAKLYEIVCQINTYLSNYMLIFLLVGCGLWFSIKTRFVQVRCFGEAWRKVFGNISLKGDKHKGGMSSFQALTTAIAAQVGTGNIVGACGAILIGGPGAIFWMWIIAFFGMATIYAEAVLAQKTRVVNADGSIDQHTYDVPMSLTSVAAGTYYAVPVLTRARVASLQTAPQQICIVPNCSPVRVTVADSATVNEDMEVVFTTCKYIAQIGGGNGLIQANVRVENKGGYNKRCTYKAYTTSGGSTTEENAQTGNFNVSANGTYSFRYSAAMSIEDARTTTVHVRVSTAHGDGTPQVITASTVPLVPAPTE